MFAPAHDVQLVTPGTVLVAHVVEYNCLMVVSSETPEILMLCYP